MWPFFVLCQHPDPQDAPVAQFTAPCAHTVQNYPAPVIWPQQNDVVKISIVQRNVLYKLKKHLTEFVIGSCLRWTSSAGQKDFISNLKQKRKKKNLDWLEGESGLGPGLAKEGKLGMPGFAARFREM